MNKRVSGLMHWTMKLSAWSLLIVAGIDLVFWVLGIILKFLTQSHRSLTGELTDFVVNFGTSIEVWGVILPLFVAYPLFKWGIQYGYSRRNIWLANITSLVIWMAVIWMAQLLKNLVAYRQMGLQHATDGLGWDLVGVIENVLTLAAIGAGFALLNRRWKWIIGIGGPVLLFFMLGSLIHLIFVTVRVNPQDLANFFMALNLNSMGTLYGGLLVWALLMFGLIYVFFMRMQLRRD